MVRPSDATDEFALLEAHQEHTVRRTATDARHQFFALLREVVANPSEIVLIEHRDLPGRGMLVGEGYRAYVRQLERLVRTLASRLRPAGSFRLVGTMTLEGDVDDDLRELRSSVDARSAEKLQRL